MVKDHALQGRRNSTRARGVGKELRVMQYYKNNKIVSNYAFFLFNINIDAKNSNKDYRKPF